jgi:hypothetical protein
MAGAFHLAQKAYNQDIWTDTISGLVARLSLSDRSPPKSGIYAETRIELTVRRATASMCLRWQDLPG